MDSQAELSLANPWFGLVVGLCHVGLVLLRQTWFVEVCRVASGESGQPGNG